MILIKEMSIIIAFRKHIYDFLEQDFQSSITHANEVGVPLHAKHCGWFDVTISASSSIGTSWYVLRNFSSSKISSPQPMAQWASLNEICPLYVVVVVVVVLNFSNFSLLH